ncbi:MAG: DsbA family protein [Acetobacteraceae bacterium]|nr:DsbA family protein [Acetobacteraceae bacterium]
MITKTVSVYSDYKSPYAYLAKDLAFALEREFPVRLEVLPYTLDIPKFLGSAEVDAAGRVIREERNDHQWRRVRYSYMDVRRQAAKRGLTVLGPRKIWDSVPAAIGMLYAQHQGKRVFRAYHDRVFERFWRRDLDIENTDILAAVLREAGGDASGFSDYLNGAGRREHDAIQARAHEVGVFGVPSFVVDGELYWGSEHLPDIRALLRAG